MQSALETFIATQLYIFLLIFARIGSAMMVMPGLSDTTVPMNVRLFITLSMSLVLMPLLAHYLPAIPANPIAFAILIITEMIVGLFFGLMAQVLMNAVNVAGFMISHVMSLSSAFTFNPQQASQSTVINSFMSMLVMTLIFVTDLHHMLFMGLVDSYRIFTPDKPLMFGDITHAMAEGLSESFVVGLQMSAPFIIVGFGVFLAMGLVARLVPQIQVFVLSMPVQIMVGFTLLVTTLSAMMMFFLGQYEEYWSGLFTGATR